MNVYKKYFFGIITVSLFLFLFILESCSSSANIVAHKPGALLWGENCVRCHNAPSPTSFSDVQWETVGMHMRVRASLTEDEVTKIVEFLQSANQ